MINGPILDNCEICGDPLYADNFYGEDDFPLCRYHHGKFWELVVFMLRQANPQVKPAPQLQPNPGYFNPGKIPGN